MEVFRPSAFNLVIFAVLFFLLNELPSCFEGFPDGTPPLICDYHILKAFIVFRFPPFLFVALVFYAFVLYVVSCILVFFIKLLRKKKQKSILFPRNKTGDV